MNSVPLHIVAAATAPLPKWREDIAKAVLLVPTLRPEYQLLLGVLATGIELSEAAPMFCRSRHTLNDWVKDLYELLGVRGRVNIAVVAVQAGLTSNSSPLTCE
jgi:DNA-binding NarL/FixJ family response regulator